MPIERGLAGGVMVNPCTCSLLLAAPPDIRGHSSQHLLIPIKHPDNLSFSYSSFLHQQYVEKYLGRCPLAVAHAPNMFCRPPGASITQRPNFYQPCAGAAFLSYNQTGKSLGAASYAPGRKKGGKKGGSRGNYLWIGHHRSFARSTKSF